MYTDLKNIFNQNRLPLFRSEPRSSALSRGEFYLPPAILIHYYRFVGR